MFELYLLEPAVRFLESLEGADRDEVRRLLDLIATDPFWDQRTKFPFAVPPAIVSLYDSGEFKIVYHLVNNSRINVWAIARSGERPRIR